MKHDDQISSIQFAIQGRIVLEFVETPSGEFHVRVPDGVSMTKAAEDFVEALQDQIPKLRMITAPAKGQA